MKNLICSCLLLLAPCLMVTAQNDAMTVVYSVSGKVKYAPAPGAKMEKLRAGTELSSESVVKIYPGASLGVVYEEEYAVLNTAGEQKVAAMTEDVNLFKETDLSELFGESIDDAYNPYLLVRSGFTDAGDPPPPPPSKPSKDGAGNKEFRIIRLQPTGGKVGGQNVRFRWKPADQNSKLKKYKFILRSSNDEILLEKNVKGTEFLLTPADYRLNHGRTYKWQVVAEEDENVKTPSIIFESLPSNALAQIRNKLNADEMYQKADPAAKQMIEANVLEQAGFLGAAHDLYEAAAKKNKKNQLAQLLFQSFQWEHDMIE